MLGDCYTCAIVAHLSKDELMGDDVVNLSENQTSTNTRNNLVPELIVVSVVNDRKPEKNGM